MRTGQDLFRRVSEAPDPAERIEELSDERLALLMAHSAELAPSGWPAVVHAQCQAAAAKRWLGKMERYLG